MPVAVFVGTLIGRDSHGRLRILLEFPDRAVLFRAGLVAREQAPHRPVHETDFGLVLVAAWPRTNRPAEADYRRDRSNAMMQHRVAARVRLARYAFLQRAQMVRGLRAELVELAETVAELPADLLSSSLQALSLAGVEAQAEAAGGPPASSSVAELSVAEPAAAEPVGSSAATQDTAWLADLRAGN